MQYTVAALALAGLAMASPSPQAVTAAIAPPGGTPAGCVPDYSGNFEITIVKPSNTKRSLHARQATNCGQTGILTINLANSQLHDLEGRTGYIAGNNSQLQFDKPVQAGGEYTSGFTVCKNGSLALGPTTTFYQCLSGGFYNLYYANVAAQCEPVNIDIIPCAGNTNGPAGVPVSGAPDGQPQATAAASVAPVSVFSDGQPQATLPATSVKPVPVSVYTDGQPQNTANATVKAPAPTIVPGAAANLGVSGALFAGVAAAAAALL